LQKSENQIRMSSPDLTDAEKDAIRKVLDTPVLSMGEQLAGFEEAVRNYVGVDHAIAVSSGTAGLHLCVRAAGISENDLVITTPFSFVASSNVILYEKAIPVFVDVDPVTGNINSDLVKQAVSDLMSGGSAAEKWLPRKGAENAGELKAVLPVDVFGQPAEMDAINSIAKQHNLTVIEDSCEAIGAEYKGRPAGTLGDMAVFAFYPNKQMTTGEGGMIVTNDSEKAGLMRSLRNQGRDSGGSWLNHKYLGYNYRMHELSAALGKIQVSRLDEMIRKRAQVANWYSKYLADLPVELPHITADTTRMSWFVYVIRLPEDRDQEDVINKLKEMNIPARAYFSPIHLQSYMQEKFGFQKGDYPITEELGSRGIALPFSSVMTEEEVVKVSKAIKEVR
jgi:perosamine synthetase